jgi:hypothetical protein
MLFPKSSAKVELIFDLRKFLSMFFHTKFQMQAQFTFMQHVALA